VSGCEERLAQMSAELAESERRWRRLADTVADVVWTADLQGRYTWVSPSVERFMGLPAEAVIGLSMVDRILPEDAARIQATFIAELAKPPGERAPLHTFEFRVQAADGSLADVESTATWALDEHGQPVGIQGATRFITERKRAEAALRASEASWRGLFNSVSEAVYILSLDGRFLDVNRGAEAMYGYTRGEIIGLAPEDLSAPGRNDLEAHGALLAAAAAGTPQRFEWWGQRRDGTVILKEVSLSRGVYFGQEVLVAVARDVTEQRQMQARLLQASKVESLGLMAGGVAHDFNNILTVILGHLDLALRHTPVDSPAAAGLRDASQAAQRAADLCRQMLAYTGKAPFVVRPTDLNELARETALILAPLVPPHVHVTLAPEPGLPAVDANVTELRQVLMNLLLNAVEAIGDRPGTVRVLTETSTVGQDWLDETLPDRGLNAGPYVCLRVIDDGCGIPEAVLPRILDPFYTSKFTGRGLGLSVVRGIVVAHRGFIHIDTEVGRGTVFSVCLPACAQTAAAPAPAPVAELWRGAGTVLVIDDESGMRTVTARLLRELGFDAITASSGEEALALGPDRLRALTAVVLDYSMPEMDGAQTVPALRAAGCDAPIVLCSGYTECAADPATVDLGLAGFLRKPYRLNDLRRTLRDALAG